jgi:hypothetical protein
VIATTTTASFDAIAPFLSSLRGLDGVNLFLAGIQSGFGPFVAVVLADQKWTLDGISGSVLGVLTALIVANLTKGTGRFNLAQGFVGTFAGIGASLSTTVSSLVVGGFGRAVGFLGHCWSGSGQGIDRLAADAGNESNNS